MVSLTSQSTSTWSTGYNGVLNIVNNTKVNYLSNWNLLCTLPTNSSITWSDSLNISVINSKNQVTLTPRSYIMDLSPGVSFTISYGGVGTIPIVFQFISGTVPVVPTPVPVVPTPVPVVPIPTNGINTQKRIVFCGYWLTDEIIQPMVTALKNANITHLLLTFITQPDCTKPLNAFQSMLSAFQNLQPSNQSLLLNNFKVGISVGGALGMPVPYSLTFSQNTSYYYNNPGQYATDIYNLLKGTGLQNYIDLDIEGINDMFPQCATFIGEVCKKYKSIVPTCIIGSSPQPPYFCPQFGGVYNLIYRDYNQYINYFFIQYYNNGPANTFEQIFTHSDPSVAPKTSVLELISVGMDPSFIVVGKTVLGESNSANGYVDLPTTMTSIVQQAFNTPSLSTWCKTGGLGIWYYNSQSAIDINNTALQTYFSSVSKF